MASDTKALAAPAFAPGEKFGAKRSEVIGFSCDVTMDPNTANNWLTLSDGDEKATHGAWQRYADRPERFSAHPQVMAKQGLQEVHYWEVEWSDSPHESVYVGVAYSSIDRKSDSSDSEFGNNTKSWVLGKYAHPDEPEAKLRAWHDGKVWEDPVPSGGCNKVGVLLDWPNGTLSFYRVLDGELIILHQFETKFTEPVFPCFWLGKCGNYITLCPE